ncbi:hypothetical protein [Janibacter melonis]|uniref:hypothetical protein n=1 Tax=Janibacter melonis TaxID=262209 RepID=UPI00174CE576|nr:hypothetical protein [Janibacter melonis]
MPRTRRTWRTWRVDRLLLLCLAATLVAPVAALLGAATHGWAPHGDDATIVLRSWDALSGHPPLTGMRSTSGDAGHPELASHHLGPLELYLLSLPLALAAGHPMAVVATTTTLAAVVGLLVVVWGERLGGRLAAVLLAAAVVLVQWSVGPEGLYRPFNPFHAVLPVLLLLVLTWAVVRGDHRALPPFAVVGALVLQANLAFVPLVLVLLVVVTATSARRARQGRERRPGATRSYRWAAALGLLVWAPPLVELVAHHPNNAVQVLRWAIAGTGDPVGPVAALRHLALLAPVPGGFRALSDDLLAPTTPIAPLVGGLVLLGLAVVSTGWRVPHGRDSVVQPARVALAANLALLATASQLPQWPAAPYWVVHWLPVAAFSWVALLWWALAHVGTVRPELPGRHALPAGAAVTVLAAVLAAAAPSPDVSQDQAITALGRQGATALGPGECRAVVVEGRGFIPLLAAAPGVAYELRRAGWRPHHLTTWPHPEDAEHLWTQSAPRDAERLVVVDSDEPELATLPPTAEQLAVVDLPVRGSSLTLYRVPGSSPEAKEGS